AGLIGGGQLGCQYQWNSLVFGLEGTYSWANVRQGQPSTVLPFHERSIEISQIGTVAARLGYASHRTMLYAKGGWAGVKVSARALHSLRGAFGDFIDWSSGGAGGVGVEHVRWQKIGFGVEAIVYGAPAFDHGGRDNAGVPFRLFNAAAPIWAIPARASYLFAPPIVTRYVN